MEEADNEEEEPAEVEEGKDKEDTGEAGLGSKEEPENPENAEEQDTKTDNSDGTDQETTGNYSDEMLYMSAGWFLKGLAEGGFEDLNNRVISLAEAVDMEETLPGSWLVYAQTDLENPANATYNPDAPEPYYPVLVRHYRADVSVFSDTEADIDANTDADGDEPEYRMTLSGYEQLDSDTGEMSVDDTEETLIGAIKEDETVFDGSVKAEVFWTCQLHDRFYAVGELNYPSGESMVFCMVRGIGSTQDENAGNNEKVGNDAKVGNGENAESDENGGSKENEAVRPDTKEVPPDRDKGEEQENNQDEYWKSMDQMDGLYPYLMQSMTYDDGYFGPSGGCYTVHVEFDDENKQMKIYEYGLFDEPDMILPWDPEIKAPKGEYEDEGYVMRADLEAVADGTFAGVVEMPDMELTGYFRFDPLIPLEKGEWEYDPDFEGFQWVDVRKFEENKDGHLNERFDPEKADREEIWLVNTTGETTLWDWAIYMEGYSRVSDLLIEEAQEYAEQNGLSMGGWMPHKTMLAETNK